ncbi:MAG: bifunctional pyr operon transcriptional regulator/uracil phosphoribosyltransferase PyrR [Bacteroidetes bacterium]|nr:bifunctional pyr operon transcriptional regulator/uracil phosphoribosyltransferase PyrR [Bacteroidota bacterium]
MDSSFSIKAQLMDEGDLSRTLDRMARQIIELVESEAGASTAYGLIGMQTRGVFVARRLRERIKRFVDIDIPVGVLDATMYRDDFRIRLRQPEIQATDIPFDVTERHLVLVDDVLYTGRTIRAALDALMDIGRPASVNCLVVVDRGLQELPIKADIVGRVVPTIPGEEVRVRLSETDDVEGVWLVERVGQASNR